MKTWLRFHWIDVAMAALGLSLAIALRASLIEFKSVDFFNYTKDWYNTLKAEGFSALGRDFSNYNLPYLYLLYGAVRVFPDTPPVIAIKIPSLLADFLMAFLVFQITRMKYRTAFIPVVSAFALLITPTVVLNGAFWGQADAIYVCVLLGCIYVLHRGEDGLAMALFGLALSFKAQSLFLVPVIAGLVLRREIRWHSLLWIPAVFLVMLLPALAAGRSFLDLLLIYPSQAGQYEQLTLHAPSALAWLPDTGRYFDFFNSAGLIVAAAVTLLITWAIYRSPAKLTPALLTELALISAIVIPFVLPRMHERYFFLADVLSIVTAFLVPSLFFVPLVMVTISFFSYQPTLFGAEPLSMGLLALGVLLLLTALVRHALPQLVIDTARGYRRAQAVE